MTSAAPARATRVLFALLVALTALAGWTVSASHASAARIGASVSGTVVKQAGPVATRAVRGSAAASVTSLVQRASATTRAGLHDGDAPAFPLLAVLAGAVALGALAVRRAVDAERTRALVAVPVALRRGRSPPAGTPVPA